MWTIVGNVAVGTPSWALRDLVVGVLVLERIGHCWRNQRLRPNARARGRPTRLALRRLALRRLPRARLLRRHSVRSFLVLPHPERADDVAPGVAQLVAVEAVGVELRSQRLREVAQDVRQLDALVRVLVVVDVDGDRDLHWASFRSALEPNHGFTGGAV